MKRVRSLISILLVLVMLGSVVMPAFAKPTKIQKMQIKIDVKENSKTSTVVQVNDVLITLKSNRDLTKAKLKIEDLKTHNVYIYEYKVNKKPDGRYIVEVYSEGKLLNKYESKYNPLDPTATKKLLLENSKNSRRLIRALSYSYWWDGVKFVRGYGVKYPHPDYKYYRIEPWETCWISGDQLIHVHIADWLSKSIVDSPPVVAGAIIGAIIDEASHIAGAALGALLGAILTPAFEYITLDENGCIWVWFAKAWEWKWIPISNPPYWIYAYVPKYLRISAHTFWDDLGIGNP